MAATGYTTGDPQKIDVAGDTMTGELRLPDSSPDTALTAASRGYVDNSVQAATAASETRYVNVTGDTMTGRLQMTAGNTDFDVQQAVSTALDTGVIYGGEINATPGVTGSVRIGTTVGYILDFITTPSDPSVTLVSFAQKDVALDSAALARATTWLLADSSGNIIQQATRPTNTQRRTHLQLGVVAQVGGTLFIDQSLPVLLKNPINQVYDLMYALGSFNVSGNNLAPAVTGATLQLQKSVGTTFVPASNNFSGPTPTNDPHVSPTPAQNPVSIRYVTSVPAAPTALVTSVIPGNYDVGGVVTPVPGGTNTSTIQRVFLIPANATADQVLIQYGSVTYASLDDAVNALATESFTQNPNLADAILIGYVVLTKTATDLNSTTQAHIFGASKFGGQPSGGAALGVLSAFALLSGAAFTGDVSINSALLSILGTGKGFRLRPTGSALDFEGAGADLLLSMWSGATVGAGTQRSYDRLSADALNVQHAGQREWVDALYGAVRHTIESGTGVARFGSKNGLTNIRFCGFKNSAGAPTTQTWLAGDLVIDSAGVWHLCTAGGTPGTWT